MHGETMKLLILVQNFGFFTVTKFLHIWIRFFCSRNQFVWKSCLQVGLLFSQVSMKILSYLLVIHGGLLGFHPSSGNSACTQTRSVKIDLVQRR